MDNDTTPSSRPIERDIPRDVFDLAPEPLSVHEMVGDGSVIVAVNPAACAMLGYEREDLIGLKSKNLFAGDEEEYIHILDELRLHGRYIFECDVLAKDGRKVPTENYAAFFERDGRKLLLCMIRDVTMRKRTQDELEQTRQRAAEAEAYRSRLLCNVSHELRTPLNAILGTAQLLRDSIQGRMEGEGLDIIIDSARNLALMVSDLIDLSDTSKGEFKAREQEFSLHDLFRQLEGVFRHLSSSREFEFTAAIGPNVPDRVLGYPARIKQVYSNLLDNAFKFTNRGKVEVALTAMGGGPDGQGRTMVAFTVRDTGLGIPEAKQRDIFECFEIGEDVLVKKHGGLGLGLAICKGIAEHLGGELTFTSRFLKGSEFTFVLPLALVAAPEPESCPLAFGTGIKVLYAEDDVVSRTSILRLLNRAGVAAKGAVNGKQALEMLAIEPFDLVLMDLEMPIMDGIMATKAIRSGRIPGANPDIPIVALTAYALERDRKACERAGMNGFVTKPVDFDKLVIMVREYASREGHPQGEPTTPRT